MASSSSSKRRRSDENEDESIDATYESPKPHDTIWYFDGNVVLASDKHLFRVHKSILADRSTVFKDMFDLPTPEDQYGPQESRNEASNLDYWEGLPIVRMAGDSDEEVANFLSAVYKLECVIKLSVHSALI